jgi:hypothetical protein
MAESQNRMVCEGCGKQFSNRQELEQHRAECPAVQAQQRGASATRTHGAGSSRPEHLTE